MNGFHCCNAICDILIGSTPGAGRVKEQRMFFFSFCSAYSLRRNGILQLACDSRASKGLFLVSLDG